ncbi:hypothetical protein EGR_10817 [Echinococcus granulosus]|uniref:Uncharacterized protein n=1 Tax=Echinococcus granulosus TaxID=6210 RepID=W6ULC9_ECHGR|nr:hypothetical protein EGR_10817 [Echinococcus granulosus]EUB54329.1 hypothetical protein EGR_10817 [Echinococcus granulosus]
MLLKCSAFIVLESVGAASPNEAMNVKQPETETGVTNASNSAATEVVLSSFVLLHLSRIL